MTHTQTHIDTHKIIITGGGTGLGLAVAQAFVDQGAQVFACGIEQQCNAAVFDTPNASYCRVDVRDERACAAFTARAVSQMGGLTGAVNAAGISHHAGKMADLRPIMVEDVWRTNVMGVWHAMRHQIKAMEAIEAKHKGVIVNIASILSDAPAQWMAAYGMSKYAVAGLSESAAEDYKTVGIRINAVSPGPIKTPMLERALADVGGDMSKFAGGFPEGGPADPAVIAHLCLRLIGPEGQTISGKNIILNGNGTPRDPLF